MISPDLTIEGEHYYYGAEDDGGDTPNLAWLEQAIDEAHDAGRWVVVGMHKNCISVGEYYCDVYQDLFTALIEHHVDLVLSGHDHSFQRSKQISTGPGCPEVVVDEFDPGCVADSAGAYRAGAGTVFVVAAAGGAELYDVHPDDPEAKYFAATMGRNTRGRPFRVRPAGHHAGADVGALRRFDSRQLRGRVRDRARRSETRSGRPSRTARSRSRTRPSP